MNETAIKVLIVDDEPLARRRIRSFSLEAHGFEIVGEAENGEQAWGMIQELAPDIVVADIGMPLLNGLDLMERAFKRTAPPKFILLTCYEDFDKVQSALRLGAHDYITKLLLSEKEFISCLNKAADNIRQERQHLQKVVRQLLLEMLSSGTEAKASLEQLSALSFPSRQHHLALIRFTPELTRVIARAAPVFEISDGPYLSLILPVEPGLWAMLAVTSEVGNGAFFLGWTTSVLQRGFDACRSLGVLTVQTLSSNRADLLHLPRSLEECRELMDLAFHAPIGTPVTAASERNQAVFPTDRFDSLLRTCRAAIERGDLVVAADTLQRWVYEVEQIDRPEPSQLRYMGTALSGSLPDSYTWRQEDRALPLRQRLQTRMDAALHMTEIREAVNEAAEWLRERLPSHGIRSEIREALRFIEERYQEEIDLTAAAKHVCLSPSWFGTLFRNEIGRSFFDYLQDYRLERARELLLHSDLKIYEIAVKAGIPNSRYFSRLFADKYGGSPQDFRSKLRGTRCQQ